MTPNAARLALRSDSYPLGTLHRVEHLFNSWLPPYHPPPFPSWVLRGVFGKRACPCPFDVNVGAEIRYLFGPFFDSSTSLAL